MFSRNGPRVQKVVPVCVQYLCDFMLSEKVDQTILATLIAHHTPTVTSGNGTSLMNMEISAYQYLLLLKNHLPTSIKLS